MINEFEVRKEICEIGKRIYNRGMVAANDGNISVKIGKNEFIATPTGVSKGFMTPNMLVKVNGEGKVLESDGIHKPSSEIKMHLRVYKERPDVNSVVHAHPIYATTFAIAGIPLNKNIMPEAVISLGEVPIAKYGTPSTAEIPDAVVEFLPNYDSVLLENHGALSWGDSLLNAYFKMESLEFYAQLLYQTMQIGGPKEIPQNEVNKLYYMRKYKYGIKGNHPGNEIADEMNASMNGSESNKASNDMPNNEQLQSIIEQVTKAILAQQK